MAGKLQEKQVTASVVPLTVDVNGKELNILVLVGGSGPGFAENYSEEEGRFVGGVLQIDLLGRVFLTGEEHQRKEERDARRKGKKEAKSEGEITWMENAEGIAWSKGIEL